MIPCNWPVYLYSNLYARIEPRLSSLLPPTFILHLPRPLYRRMKWEVKRVQCSYSCGSTVYGKPVQCVLYRVPNVCPHWPLVLGVTDTDNSREFHAAADPSPVAGRLHPAVGRLARGGAPAHHPRHDWQGLLSQSRHYLLPKKTFWYDQTTPRYILQQYINLRVVCLRQQKLI